MDKFVKSQKRLKKHTINRAIAWLLAVLMCFSALPTGSMTVHATDAETVTGYWTDDAYVATGFAGGDGTEGNPYIIEAEAQLAYMAQVLSGEAAADYKSCFFKMADGVTELKMSEHEWTPITEFAGVFDGNGVTIDGLTIKTTSTSKVGFFAILNEGAKVQNVNFTNVNINVSCDAEVPFCVGTIAGRVNGATIDNCKVLSGNVKATGQASKKDIFVGGLVGDIHEATGKTIITNCFNNSSVEAETSVGRTMRLGGIFGSIDQENANAEIINCANTGSVTGTNTSANASSNRFGGFGGYVNNGTVVIKNCYNAGVVSAGTGCKSYKTGSILGVVGAEKGTIENCYYVEGTFNTVLGTATALTAIQSADFVTTLNTNANILSATYSGLLNWKLNTDNYPIQFVETTQGDGSGSEETLFDAGTGTEADPFIIEDEADLLLMAEYCNSKNGASGTYFKVKDGVDTISLTADWVPIVSFAGSFDGNNVTIDGLTIKTTSAAKTGFFSILNEGAKVKNINFTNVNINVSCEATEPFCVGTIAGRVNGTTIDNCKVLSGTVKATGQATKRDIFVGGLVGDIYKDVVNSSKTIITNCFNNSSVEAETSVGRTMRLGGIYGSIDQENANAEIINCANIGSVTGTNTSDNASNNRFGGFGGIVTKGTVVIKNCYNAGVVSAGTGCKSYKTGSILGVVGAEKGTIENCYYVEGTFNTVLGTATALTSIQSVDFVTTLNLNATGINAELGKTLANSWQMNAANYPIPTNEAAEIAYVLGVSANTELGLVTTEVKAPEDGATYEPHSATDLLAEGTMVRLTCAPNTGYFVESITVNDSAVDLNTLTNGVYEFALTANTTVEVVFAGYDLTVMVNDSLMGSVLTTVMIPGASEYVAYNSEELPSGTSVRLTWTTNSGCEVDKITVNDEEATITNSTGKEHIFTLTEDTTVEVAFTAGEVSVADIYVNPGAQAGGDGSLTAPFQTLEEAKAKIAELITATPNIDITVHLMGGTYRLDAPLELGVTETSYRRVSFVDYDGDEETPVITSAKVIAPGSFTKVEGKDYYSYQLPETAKVGGAWPQFRDLLVDGELATLAKTEIYLLKKNGTITEETGTKLLENIYVDEALVEDITTSNLGNLEICYKYKWNFRRFHFEEVGINEEGLVPLRVRRAEAIYTGDYAALANKEYWLQNHISFLDEPGEFYYEETTGTIYYYPCTDQDMTKVVVEYPTLDTLIEIGGENVKALVAADNLEQTYAAIRRAEKAIQNGENVAENRELIDQYSSIIATLELDDVANFTFDGITFTGTTFNWLTNRGLFAGQGCTFKDLNKKNSYGQGEPGDNVTCAAIYAEYADGIRVQNCTFTQLGGHAMLFNYGIDDLQVVGNSVTDVGMIGITVGAQQRRLMEDGVQGNSSDIIVSNNYISNIGMVVLNAAAIRVARGENMEITHNTIIHAPYSGIQLGWGYTIMEIEKFVDPSPSLQNAEVSYNYIEDTMYALNDGGAIYTNASNDLVTNTDPINFIHHNYIRAGAHDGTYTGVYYDGAASNWCAYNNVIDDLVSLKGPMFFQDDVDEQYSHNILVEDNYTTVSEITQKGTIDMYGYPRNITLKNNTLFADRSKLNQDALEIMQNAGIESAYAHLVDPMNVALQIADNTMHYVVDRSTGCAEVNVKLTNNSDSTRTYTLSLLNELPYGLEAVYPENGLTLEAGTSGIATITLQATDKDSLTVSAASVVGIRVTDNTGRTLDYPRTFSVKTSMEGGSTTPPVQRPESEVPAFDATLGTGTVNIAYGTPVVDGVMDDMYKNSCKIEDMGTIVYPKDGNGISDVKATTYLVWDQTYLYCCFVVEDSTVMSAGLDYMKGKANPWKTDTLEFYLKMPISGVDKHVKFSVDAFGTQAFGEGVFETSYHESLPYATSFTHNGNIIKNYAIKEPTTGQIASTTEQPVTGYVVEMALPLTEAVGVKNKSPWVGDQIGIKVQTNDLQSIISGTYNIVAFRTDEIVCTLNGKVSSEPEATPTPTPVPSEVPTATPTPSVDPTATPAPSEAPTATPVPTSVPSDSDSADDESAADDNGAEQESFEETTAQAASTPTGDNSRYGLWLAMLVLACGAAISILIVRRKNRI